MTVDDARDEFSRLHGIFTFHFGVAVGLAWMTSLYSACYAPWVHNIRALMDPAGGFDRVESTWSFLFAMPAVLTIAWVSVFFGREVLRRAQTLPNVVLEFSAAAVVAFGMFYLSVDRAVSAFYAGM